MGGLGGGGVVSSWNIQGRGLGPFMENDIQRNHSFNGKWKVIHVLISKNQYAFISTKKSSINLWFYDDLSLQNTKLTNGKENAKKNP